MSADLNVHKIINARGAEEYHICPKDRECFGHIGFVGSAIYTVYYLTESLRMGHRDLSEAISWILDRASEDGLC